MGLSIFRPLLCYYYGKKGSHAARPRYYTHSLCHTKLRRVGRTIVGGVGVLSVLVVGSGVVGTIAGATRPRSSSFSRSIPHGQKTGPVYSSWHSEHSQWLQRPSGCPPPSNSARAHPSHVGMVPSWIKCSDSERVSQSSAPAKCPDGALAQQQLHYDGEHSCRAPSAPPAIAPPRRRAAVASLASRPCAAVDRAL